MKDFILHALLYIGIALLLIVGLDWYQDDRDEARHQHDAAVYKQGYKAGWEAKENGELFDPEYDD